MKEFKWLLWFGFHSSTVSRQRLARWPVFDHLRLCSKGEGKALLRAFSSACLQKAWSTEGRCFYLSLTCFESLGFALITLKEFPGSHEHVLVSPTASWSKQDYLLGTLEDLASLCCRMSVVAHNWLKDAKFQFRKFKSSLHVFYHIVNL